MEEWSAGICGRCPVSDGYPCGGHTAMAGTAVPEAWAFLGTESKPQPGSRMSSEVGAFTL